MKTTQLSLFDDVPAQEYDTAGGDEYADFVEKFKPKKDHGRLLHAAGGV